MDQLEKINQQILSARSTALSKVGLTEADLAKLNMLPLVTGIAGIFVIIIMWGAVATPAWVKGTALFQGQPFEAHLSLTDVQFGSSGQDSQTVCGYSPKCSLSFMCDRTDIPVDADGLVDVKYTNGIAKYTNPSVWCDARNAGASTLSLLWIGFIPGLVAVGATLMYASKQIDVVGKQFVKLQNMGFTDNIQKIIISACWGAYWAFLFFAMTSYAAVHPDSLGWGPVTMQSSFGLIRFAFFLVSIFSSLLVASFFDLWHTDNVVEAWAEFSQTDLFTAKKALYLQLMIQLGLYLVYTIVEVDWAMLLIIICGYYLDAKKRNFMLMYLVIVSVTLLLDIIKIGALPDMAIMTPGQKFGAIIYFLIFGLKFGIIAAIYLYQQKEDQHPTAFAFSQMPDGAGRGEDEIAE